MASKEGKNRYTFLEPEGMPRARASLYFSLGSGIVMIACVIISFAMKGKAPDAIGALGFAGALTALYAFYLGIRSLAVRDSRQRMSIAASIVSGLLVIAWLAFFLNGIKVG